MKIVAVCGSLRKGSVNRMLLQALAERAPEGVLFEIAELHGIPVYNGDLEVDGLPAAVTALQDHIVSGDALLLASPEYNGGVPGPLKNAMDWCSRGGRNAEVFAKRPVGLVGATPGRSGTRMAQQAWLQTFRQLGLEHWGSWQMYVDGAMGLFDGEGRLTDEGTAERCARFMAGFADFVSRR